MSAAMLQSMLTERLGEGAVEIRASGFGPVDLPPIGDAGGDAVRRWIEQQCREAAMHLSARAR